MGLNILLSLALHKTPDWAKLRLAVGGSASSPPSLFLGTVPLTPPVEKFSCKGIVGPLPFLSLESSPTWGPQS